MCMSSVYEKKGSEEIFLYRNIANVEIDKGLLTFTNILGEKTDFKGSICRMDFINNIILVEKNKE